MYRYIGFIVATIVLLFSTNGTSNGSSTTKTGGIQKHAELLGLQALRGLAALLVVAHHTAGTLARAKYGGHELVGGLLFPLGRAGVDLFFVLSGFIIYYVHHADIACPDRFRNYAVRRLSRI